MNDLGSIFRIDTRRKGFRDRASGAFAKLAKEAARLEAWRLEQEAKDLLPCPNCGGLPELVYPKNDKPFVRCSECGLRSAEGYEKREFYFLGCPYTKEMPSESKAKKNWQELKQPRARKR